MEETKKPNPVTPQWWLKKEIIDEDGNVFRKGKFICHKDETEKYNAVEPEVTEDETEKPKVKKEVSPEVVDKQQETIDRLIDLLAKQQQPNQVDLAREIAEAINAAKDGRRIHRGLDTLDKNDILDPPVTISASGAMYAIYDYKAKNGDITINPTAEVILLKYKGTKKFKTDKQENQRHFCSIPIRSKKLLEWIREAPYYGIQVFENSNQALSSDLNVVQEMAQLWNRIDNMDRAQLVKCGEIYKIENYFGLPIEVLKREVAKKMADENILKKEQAHLEKAREMRTATLTK